MSPEHGQRVPRPQLLTELERPPLGATLAGEGLEQHAGLGVVATDGGWIVAMDSFSSAVPYNPVIVMQPSPTAEISIGECPSFRCFIRTSPLASQVHGSNWINCPR